MTSSVEGKRCIEGEGDERGVDPLLGVFLPDFEGFEVTTGSI